jgi:GTP-binding protein HflX
VAVWLSAKTGVGLDLIGDIIREQVVPQIIHRELRLEPTEGRLRAQLYQTATVISEQVDDEGCWVMQVEGSPERFKKLRLIDDTDQDSHLDDALIA